MNQRHDCRREVFIVKRRKGQIFALCAAVLLAAGMQPVGAAELLGSQGLQTEAAAIGAQTGVSDSSAGFALSLLRGLHTSGQNALISPVSAEFALGMAANGADSQTLEQLEQVLGGSPEILNSTNLSRKNSLEQSGVQVANSVWMNTQYGGIPQGNPVWDQYAETLEQYYSAQLGAEDLGSTEGIGAVNAWVNENTNGMIPSIFDSPDSGMRLCLVNALSMDAKWVSPYDPSDVHEGTFTTASGAQQQAEFMDSTEEYFQVDGAAGIRKYYRDSTLAFTAILPDGTLDAYLDTLTAEDLAELWNTPSSGRAQSSLPKFKIEQQYHLNDTLSQMGLTDAFNPDAADFSGITGEENLYISTVVQKTMLEVNEDGTKAAAATGIGINVTSAPLPPEHTIEFNRPFLFAVVDTQTNTPVFLGVCESVE